MLTYLYHILLHVQNKLQYCHAEIISELRKDQTDIQLLGYTVMNYQVSG